MSHSSVNTGNPVLTKLDRAYNLGMKKKAVIYTRISVKKTDGVSLDAQLSLCEKYADLHELEVEGNFCDDGISAKSTKGRTGLEEALAMVKKSKGVLIIYSLSRLSRSVVDTCLLVEELQKSKADLASVSENLSTDGPCGKFVLSVMSAMNQLEREQVGLRTKMAMAHLKETGKRFSNDAPYGFSHEEGNIVPNHEEQKTLKYMKELKEKGNSLRLIAVKLELHGIRNRKGKPFQFQSVARILKNQ